MPSDDGDMVDLAYLGNGRPTCWKRACAPEAQRVDRNAQDHSRMKTYMVVQFDFANADRASKTTLRLGKTSEIWCNVPLRFLKQWVLRQSLVWSWHSWLRTRISGTPKTTWQSEYATARSLMTPNTATFPGRIDPRSGVERHGAGLEVLDQLRRHPRRRPRARRAVPDAKEKDARFGLWTATVRSRVTLSRGASPTRRAETRRVVGSRTRSTVRNRAARVAARSTSTPKVAARHMTQRWTCCWTTAWRRGWGERCRLMCPL
jgi:hypothetical protein